MYSGTGSTTTDHQRTLTLMLAVSSFAVRWHGPVESLVTRPPTELQSNGRVNGVEVETHQSGSDWDRFEVIAKRGFTVFGYWICWNLDIIIITVSRNFLCAINLGRFHKVGQNMLKSTVIKN